MTIIDQFIPHQLSHNKLLTWTKVSKQLPPKGVPVLCKGTVKLCSRDYCPRDIREDFFIAFSEPRGEEILRFRSKQHWFNVEIDEVIEWRYIELPNFDESAELNQLAS